MLDGALVIFTLPKIKLLLLLLKPILLKFSPGKEKI